MSKHTYGFPAGTNRDEAIASALAQARADGFVGEEATATVVESDAHRDNDEFVVVVRGGANVIG